MKHTLLAGASSFAHLLTGRAPAPRAEETPDEKKPDDKKDGKKGKRSEEGEGDGEGDDGAGGDDDDDDDGDDESDDADMKKKGTAGARKRERARCAAIFRDAAAGVNPALAAELAFGTNLPRSQAVAVLRSGTAGAPKPRQSLDARMTSVVVPPVGVSDPVTPSGAGANATASAIIAAGKKRRGEA